MRPSRWSMQATRLLVILLTLYADPLQAQPETSSQAASLTANRPLTPSTGAQSNPRSSAGAGGKSRGGARGRKGRRAGGRKGRRGGNKRRKPEPLPEPGTLAYMWHVFIWAYTYPFYYLNDHYGPFAANAFGFAVILAIFVLPSAFKPTRDRELKLKERLVRAKNTRIRVKAAQTIDQYLSAVDILTKDVDELGFPLRGLRKMYRLPPASPVTYSKAIKELKKEVIHVNDRIYPVQPKSLDQALQDLRGCLARELEVSTEEAGEMASTVVHRSNQPRTVGDPSLALRAMVADNPLVEIRLFDETRKPLMINCRDGKVEVRREAIYVVVPAGGAEPLVYFQLFFSINFRSTTDEGTLKIMRWTPGSNKRPKKSKHELGDPEPKPWGMLAVLQDARHQADLWIERKINRVTAIVTWPWRALGLSAPPAHGVDAERARVFAVAVQEANSADEMLALVREFLKATTAVPIRSLFEALDLEPRLELSEEEAHLQLKEHSVAIDGVVVADVGAGIVQRVRAKLQRRMSESMALEGGAEEVDAIIQGTIYAAARQCTGEEAYQAMAALFRHRKIDVDIVRDRVYSHPIEITAEGGEVVTEYRSLFSIVNYSQADPSVMQWIGVRHRTSGSREVDSLGSLQFEEMAAPAPAAKPPKSIKSAKSTKSSSNAGKDHNTRVLAKVRARLKELEKIKRGNKTSDPDSEASSPTSSKYPSTVGSRPSSAGSSPQVIEDPIPASPTNSTVKHPTPLNLDKPSVDPSLKPRSAALARAFLKRVGHTPPATPEDTKSPASSNSNGSPTEARPAAGQLSSTPPAVEVIAEKDSVRVPDVAESQSINTTTEEAAAKGVEESGSAETQTSRGVANGKSQQENPATECPQTPPAQGGKRRKSLDPLDDGFEDYYEKLVQSSPQILKEASDSDEQDNSDNGVVDQARAYLASRKVVEDAKEAKPEWLQAVEQASRSAEQARLAASAALDRIKTGNTPLSSPLASPMIHSRESPLSTP